MVGNPIRAHLSACVIVFLVKSTHMDIQRTALEVLQKFWLAFKSVPVILASFGLAFLLLALTWLVLLFFSSPEEVRGIPTAVLAIIPGPSSTPFIPTKTPTRVPTTTPDIPPSPLPGMIGVGSYVQIFGTEGAGLNIREGAGLSFEVRFVAYDAEVFEVGGGPTVVDDITWWFVVTPVDESRSGWAAANYLTIVNEP